MTRIQKTPRWAVLVVCLAALAACAPEHEPSFDPAAATAASPAWTRTDAFALGAQLALDPSGNVLAAGTNGTGITVSKLDPAGALLWQRTFDSGVTAERASWIAVDGAGNAFVSGSLFFGGAQDPGGFVLLKYDPAGNLLWSDVAQVTFGETVRVEVDAAGSAYLSGKAWLAGSADVDYVTIKYGADGARLWLRQHGLSPAVDVPASLALASDGRLAVTGSPNGNAPMVTVVYDADGNPLWSATAPADRARDVAFGPGGEVYVAGGTSGLLVVKYDAAGGIAWTATAPGFGAERLGIDAAGNVLVTGIAVQTTGMPYTDWITAKLGPGGKVLWTQRYDAHANADEAARALAIAPDGAVLVTGTGGPAPVAGTSYVQLVTLEYAPDGTLTWYWVTPAAIDGLGLRLSGSTVFGIARSPMTTFRLERVAAGSTTAAPPPTSPAPAPEPSPTPSPTPPPPTVTPTTSVADISFAVRLSGAKYKVTGRVVVRDQAGAAVSGAAVSVGWATPSGSPTATATTDASGTATFVVTGRRGTYTLTVTDVAKAGYAFDRASGVLSRSVVVP